MNNTLVIAIDGPAASGKSTTARRVARQLGYVYVDSGAMYRAATLAVLRDGVSPDDRPSVETCVASHTIALRSDACSSVVVLLDGDDVTSQIRSAAVTAAVSLVSSYAGVRSRMVVLQRQLGAHGGIVMDGRDIGTVVFPDADLKIFMVADLAARAQRRQVEIARAGVLRETEDETRRQIAARDAFDSSRSESPLKRAHDAVVLDTSDLSIDEQVARVVELARQRMESA